MKGSPSNPEGEIRETQTTEARSTETVTPHTQYRNDRNDGETQNDAVTEQVRPVSRAGKSKAAGREVMCPQPGSLQSFSCVCRMFRFCGDEPVSLPTLFFEDESDTFEGKRMIREILPLSLLSLTPGRLSRTPLFLSCESQFVDFDVFSEGPDGDPGAFSEVLERSKTDLASLLEPGRVSGSRRSPSVSGCSVGY